MVQILKLGVLRTPPESKRIVEKYPSLLDRS
jgi:hypothetical protein